MTTGTIEETFEYRIKNVVKNVMKNNGITIDDIDGYGGEDRLERWMNEYAHQIGDALIDDMLEWMDDADWLELLNN